MKLSPAEQLILGILLEGPQHGYKIEQIIEERGMRNWTDIAFSSIYYLLDKLEKKALAQSSPSKGKEKKSYTITKAGLTILKEETQKTISHPSPNTSYLMIGLATSYLLSDSELKTAFMERRAILEKKQLELRDKQESGSHKNPIANRLFSLGDKQLRAELDWLKQEINQLDGGHHYGF